jgi:hypothetical protein
VLNTEERRHYIDAKLQVALELLEKAQAMVSIAWDDRAAGSNLAYVDAMAGTAQRACTDAANSARELYQLIEREEKHAEGIERPAA